MNEVCLGYLLFILVKHAFTVASDTAELINRARSQNQPQHTASSWILWVELAESTMCQDRARLNACSCRGDHNVIDGCVDCSLFSLQVPPPLPPPPPLPQFDGPPPGRLPCPTRTPCFSRTVCTLAGVCEGPKVEPSECVRMCAKQKSVDEMRARVHPRAAPHPFLHRCTAPNRAG